MLVPRLVKRAFHALDLAYYQFFLGPKGHGLPHERGDWDAKYWSGRLDMFDTLDELPRYAMIRGYVECFGQRQPAVLDVGCGSGRLRALLTTAAFEQYVGLDISGVAVDHAQRYAYPQSRFEVTDLTRWNSDERFDIIVFNEVLYYLHDPVGVLRRYSGFLNEDGLVIVSMFRHGNSDIIWRNIHRRFPTVGSINLTNDRGEVFEIRALGHPSARSRRVRHQSSRQYPDTPPIVAPLVTRP